MSDFLEQLQDKRKEFTSSVLGRFCADIETLEHGVHNNLEHRLELAFVAGALAQQEIMFESMEGPQNEKD